MEVLIQLGEFDLIWRVKIQNGGFYLIWRVEFQYGEFASLLRVGDKRKYISKMEAKMAKVEIKKGTE